MRVMVRSASEATAAADAYWGGMGHDRVIAELLRSDVDARTGSPRWSTVARVRGVLRRVGPERPDDAIDDRVQTICAALEGQGDVTTGPGATLYPSPLRAVAVGKHAFSIVTSVPTQVLAVTLPGRLGATGTQRTLRFGADAEDSVSTAIGLLGGCVLTPEAWAGLSREPKADAGWLSALDERLAWADERGNAFARDGMLRWSALVPSHLGLRWQPRATDGTRLWRARNALGRWRWAWTPAAKAPDSGPHVRLTADEASRTAFAVARGSRHPVAARLARGPATCNLWVDAWLPRAEYRYLSTLGTAVAEGARVRWSLPRSAAESALPRLVDRLGLELREVAQR